MPLIKRYPDIPVCMHQDPGYKQGGLLRGETICSSVIMDGALNADAKLPSSCGTDRRFLINVVGKDPKAAAKIAAIRQATARKWRRYAA